MAVTIIEPPTGVFQELHSVFPSATDIFSTIGFSGHES